MQSGGLIKRVVVIAALLCLPMVACKGKGVARSIGPDQTPKAPVAEAKQSVPAPSLAPPEGSAQDKGKDAQLPAGEAPKGPRTIVEGENAGTTGALAPKLERAPRATQGEPSPATIEGGPATTEETTGVAKTGEADTTIPLATLGGTEKEATKGGSEVKVLAAPLLVPRADTKADTQKPEYLPYTPKVVRAKTNIELILDASGSMAAPFSTSSQSKMDILGKTALDIISEMKAQQADYPRNLALRVFGTKYDSADNNKDDTELLIPMGEPEGEGLDRIKEAISKIKPKGMSPIALAISEAKKDFPEDENAERVIVLTADGIDNTGDDPCKPAEAPITTPEDVGKNPPKVIINVVTFDVGTDEQEKLSCIAKNNDGQFYMARTEKELLSDLDQAINSNAPYNLKLVVEAGLTALPFDFTIYQAGSEKVIKKDKSFGTKYLKLPPGTYDVLVEYSESPEKKKPSKKMMGVEILETTRLEQSIKFDLAQITLAAISNDGNPVPAKFDLVGSKTSDTVAQMETGANTQVFFITPGQYNISASMSGGGMDGFQISEDNVDVKLGEAANRIFKFQKGILTMTGLTTQKEVIPFVFQIYKSEKTDQLVASGASPTEGISVDLMPGSYEIIVVGADPKMVANPRTKITAVEIKAGEKTEITATFEMGTLKLTSLDGAGNKLPAEYSIRDKETQAEMARVKSENGAQVSAAVPPGTYDIIASSLKSNLDPKPSVPINDIKVTVEKPTEQTIKFILGTIRLRGRNAKEQAVTTQFSVYKAGSDEKVAVAPPSDDWVVFDLAPGVYDALAVTAGASSDKNQSMIWLRDIKVEDGKMISHETIFTTGKIKIIGRGTNGQIVPSTFKVFQYGKDRPLIAGTTTNDWEVFDIQPGKYYLQAGYHDDLQSVFLEKWQNISVGENEVVELVLEF